MVINRNTTYNLKDKELTKKDEFIALFILIIFLGGIAFNITFWTIKYIHYRQYKETRNLFVLNKYSEEPTVMDSINIVNRLPDSIKGVLVDNKIKIDYIGWSPDENAAGMFDLNEKGKRNAYIQVLVQSNLNGNVTFRYANQINTLHEVGHAFDCDYISNDIGKYSNNIEFINIYQEEAKRIFNSDILTGSSIRYLNYFTDSHLEYFAECFAFYFVNNETRAILEENAPKTYEYIKRITNQTDKYGFIQYLKQY